jgi:hypothetical protein
MRSELQQVLKRDVFSLEHSDSYRGRFACTSMETTLRINRRRPGTQDVPMSQLEIVFVPSAGWSPGRHEARVQVKDKRGNTTSYAWSFTVADS